MYFEPLMGRKRLDANSGLADGFRAFKQNMKSHEKIVNAKAINIFIWTKKQKKTFTTPHKSPLTVFMGKIITICKYGAKPGFSHGLAL